MESLGRAAGVRKPQMLVRANRADRDAGDERHVDAARVFVNDATQRVEAAAKSALAAMADGDTLRTLLAALRRILKATPVNTVAMRRALADAVVGRGGYILNE